MIKSSTINREKISWLMEQPVDIKARLLTQHFEICRMLVNSILEEEVVGYTGKRYKRDGPHDSRYHRYGFNPGSVRLGSQKVKLDVPRVYDRATGKFVELSNYDHLQQLPAQSDKELQAVLKGLSTRDYKSIIDTLSDSFGLSSSSVSRRFIEESKERLQTFEQRKLEQDYVALFVDGKHLAKQQIIIVLGVTLSGDKVPLGFIQSTTENSQSIAELFRDLIARGLSFTDGILVVIDGARGLRKAVNDVFGTKAVVQRCQWHKRENVVSYLGEEQQEMYRKKLQEAYALQSYQEAKQKLLMLREELHSINVAAARSLEEGMEETLTLKRLGLAFLFHRSFSTTNCIENLNSQLGKYLHKVKRWMYSEQRYRWVASGLLEIESRMRKVANYKQLKVMKEKIKKEVQNIEEKQQMNSNAA